VKTPSEGSIKITFKKNKQQAQNKKFNNEASISNGI